MLKQSVDEKYYKVTNFFPEEISVNRLPLTAVSVQLAPCIARAPIYIFRVILVVKIFSPGNVV